MQILDIKLGLVSPMGLRNEVDLPKGTIKTGLRAKFAVSVIVAGEVTVYGSVHAAWQALGFSTDYYGFGSRVQIAVARDGLAAVEHQGAIFVFTRRDAVVA